MENKEKVGNEEIKTTTETLEDLAVMEERTEEAKGGTNNQGKLLVGVDQVSLKI